MGSLGHWGISVPIPGPGWSGGAPVPHRDTLLGVFYFLVHIHVGQLELPLFLGEFLGTTLDEWSTGLQVFGAWLLNGEIGPKERHPDWIIVRDEVLSVVRNEDLFETVLPGLVAFLLGVGVKENYHCRSYDSKQSKNIPEHDSSSGIR